MKKFTLILFIFFSVVLLQNCEKKAFEINTQKQPEGTGVLKQMITVSDVNSSEAQTKTNYEYFDNGNLKKTSYSHSDEIILAYKDYEYNNKNQLERIVDYTANSNSPNGYSNLTTHEFEYSDDSLNLKETITYPVIGTSEYIIFEYNDNQYLIKKSYYGSDNQLNNYHTFKYDKFGNILKVTTYSSTGEWSGETLHYYRDNMLVKSDVYVLGKDKVHLEEILKTYDEDNNLIMLQSNILWSASSRSSYILKYFYK